MSIATSSKRTKKSKGSRKNQILNLATELFRENGYASSSVRQLALNTGIEAASIYSHFKSKADILEKICFEMAALFMIALEDAQSESDSIDRLKFLIKEHAKIILNNRSASTVMWHDWRFLEEGSKKDFLKLKNRYEKGFETIVNRGIHDGYLQDDSVVVLTNFILSSLNSMGHWHVPDKGMEEFVNRLPEFYLTGIKK